MSTTTPFTLLGGLSPRHFMAQHWQKQRQLIRGAIPDFNELLSISDIYALARSEAVESRLIYRDGKQWQLEHGPFTKKRLSELPDKNWTLLVQGLNLHVPGADALLRKFNFLPYARLDDVMISLAPPGGGVGPHFDSYDVFLLQGIGTRRWKVSEPRSPADLELDPDAPLKILKKMRADETFDLTAGDMLYLPPQVAHDGVAVQSEGFCTTYSIGFRAPTYQEFADAFLDWAGSTSELEGRLNDPELTATTTPARIPKSYQRSVLQAVQMLQMDREAMHQFAGCYATELKHRISFALPEPKLTRSAFAKQAMAKGVRLAAATQCLYDDEHLFINGEAFMIKGDVKFWRELADQRAILPTAILSKETLDSLYVWYEEGWLLLA